MDILEAADILNEIVKHIAKEKNITVQEAWKEASEELKEINSSYESKYE